ncbi:mucin-3A-like [Lissotriton helveticus]
MKISRADLFICLFLPGILTPAQSQDTTSLNTAATVANLTTITATTPTRTHTPDIKTLTTTAANPTTTNTGTFTTTSTSTTTSTTSAKTTLNPLICQNGGILSSSGNTCLCPPSYGGKTCEEPLKVCQNGGTFDSIKCVCTEDFYGDVCQYPVDEIGVATVQVEVAVEVTITNQEFTPQLMNINSEEYKVFERHFKSEMIKVYRNVPGLKYVEILSVRAGSIIVDHKVLMELELKPIITIQENYKEVVTILKEELKVFIQSQPSCNQSNPDTICLSNSTNVSEVVPPTETELCQWKAPANYSQFYFPYYFDGSSLRCVTHCRRGVPDAINCNHGECRLLRTGPRCFCQELDTYWYEGDNCSSRINKIAVYGGFGAALGVVLIVIITLAILLHKSKKKHHQQRTKKESKLNIYDNSYED